MSKSVHNFGSKAILVAIVLAAMILLATLPLSWRDQLIVGIALYAFCVYLHRTSASYRVTLILLILSIFSTGRYCMWRYLETWRFLEVQGSAALTIDLLFVTLLLAAETYAALILVLGYFQGLKPLGRKPIPLPEDSSQWPTIDVFIPTYNEPLDVVKPTVMAAVNMDYPADRFHVYILDDGRREEFREFAEAYGVTHLTRGDNRHAKAGNINAALKTTSRDLVAIFDCDHVPTRSFLQLTVGWFLADQKLGMVQTPHHFYSPDPFEKNLDIFQEVPNESALFYGVVQDGNDLWNATFFCGSCAVIRRPALAEIGGVAVETVTEDAHTSLRMQRNGWNTSYLNIPQAAGLATSSMADHIGQRIRWARGMVQILRVDTPLFGRGLTLAQRLCYFNSVVHYLYSVPRLIFLTAPLVYLLLDLSNMYGSVLTILSYALPHLALATLTTSRMQGKHRHSFWNEVYETVLAPYILFPTLAALINPKWGTFNVTSKSVISDRTHLDWRVAAPFAVLLALNLLGIAVGVSKILDDWDRLATIGINILWSSLNVVVLGASVASVIEKKQLRQSIRVPAMIPLRCELPNGEVLQMTNTDISMGGAALRIEQPAELQVADLLTLHFPLRGETVPIPAVVIDIDDKVLRVAFHRLTLEQEENVALLTFSRADFWNSWRPTTVDRPLHSFLRILEIAMRGLMAIPASLLGSMSDATKRPARPTTGRPRTVYSFVVLALILATLLAISSPAQTPQETGFRATISFREAGQREGLELRGNDASGSLRFTVPVTQLATDAQLILRYRLAASLRPETSQLDVSLNGSPVGSVMLKAAAGNDLETAALPLPAELFTSGNQITFHLRAQCDDCTPKDERRMVTLLEASSEVQFSGAVLPVPNDLALLPQPFFDPATQGLARIGFHFPAPPDRDGMTAAAMVASWLGIQAMNLETEFRVSVGELPPGNAVVIVDRSHGDTLGAACGLPDGMAAGLCQHPTDPASKLLVIAANSSFETVAAARSFVLAKGLKGRAAVLTALNALPRPANDAPRWLRSDESVPFSQFAAGGQLALTGSGSAKLYFRLAPDLHYATRSMVPLRLAFRWQRFPGSLSAKLRVMMNGTLVARRSYRGGTGNEVMRETLQVPVSALYPRNTLTFEVEYPDLPSSAHPAFEIQPDSSLDLRGVQHFAEMPRLDLFAKAGFPFTRRADLAETAVVLPNSPAPEQIALALNAVAFLSRQTGSPATLVSFISPGEAEGMRGKDFLVIGTPADPLMGRVLTGALPLVFENGAFHATEPRHLLNRIFGQRWVGLGRENYRLRDYLSGETPVTALVQGSGVAAELGRSVVQLLTPSPQATEGILSSLEQAARNDEIFGSTSLQRAGRFESFRVAEEHYPVGNLNPLQAFDYWMTKYLLLIPIIVILCALPLAPMIEAFVEQKRRERLQWQKDVTV